MSLREFASRLGVSDRMVSKWEAGGERLHPRPINQEALDTFLAKCSDDVHERFVALLDQAPVRQQTTTVVPHEAAPRPQVRHPVDGKLMALVDAGTYLSGTDNQPIWLDAFYVDVHPTTNAEYARFVDATSHPTPPHWDAGHCPEQLHQHPVVFVTWHDANAYATWADKQLPQSQQWEKAARGTAGHVYPWGNQPTPAKCNVREGAIGSTTPVDRYHSGASPYGIYDLCGNVWEWCATETSSGRYELKGSAFTSPFARATPSKFNDASASMHDDDTGFRCVTPAPVLNALLTE